MENNSEKENFRQAEGKLERLANDVEQEIDRQKDLVQREEELLKEVKGELKEIRDSEEKADQAESDSLVTIFVNGTPERVKKGEITYDQVVTFAFPDFPQHPERNYSVKYKKGHGEKPDGILSPGGKVKVHPKMIFDVTYTGQS